MGGEGWDMGDRRREGVRMSPGSLTLPPGLAASPTLSDQGGGTAAARGVTPHEEASATPGGERGRATSLEETVSPIRVHALHTLHTREDVPSVRVRSGGGEGGGEAGEEEEVEWASPASWRLLLRTRTRRSPDGSREASRTPPPSVPAETLQPPSTRDTRDTLSTHAPWAAFFLGGEASRGGVGGNAPPPTPARQAPPFAARVISASPRGRLLLPEEDLSSPRGGGPAAILDLHKTLTASLSEMFWTAPARDPLPPHVRRTQS
ncbi:hypothetical protein T484DRAFT_1977273 [Baffinella frigidus]|nr:hypothetical protein T484DRAFT_1977273 [Cryptophyta sp. CCMP2293]